MDLGLGEVWKYRSLLGTFTWRDIRVRYKQTVLGIAWIALKPLVSLVILSVIFGKLAKLDSEGFPYPVFLYAGLLPWQLFSSVATSVSQSVRTNSSLLSKVYIPRLIFPLASGGARMVDFCVSVLILLGLVAWYPSVSISWVALAVIPLAIMTLVTAMGVGLVFAPLQVAYRDFNYITGYFLQIMMYLTPVVYSVKIVPARWRWLLMLNPMSGIIDAQRSAILGKPFAWSEMGISFVVSVVLALLGIIYYRRMDRHFADIV